MLGMLCGKEYVVQKDIIGMLHSYDTVIKVLSVMEKVGLVLREDNRRGGWEIRYSLTPLGRQIADVYQTVYSKTHKN